MYWQEFAAGHDADLRITVIGDCYAVGFWRHNRPRDFRASGSGRLDYDRPIPEELLRYCLQFSHDRGFDSMAYDILPSEGGFVVLEMSYNFDDVAIHDARGHYELLEDGRLQFSPVHVWPQELLVEWVLRSSGAGTTGTAPTSSKSC